MGAVSVCLVITVYNLLFFNKYLPLSEGWFSVYAYLIAQGQMPYRDFYLLLTPLYPLQLAAFSAVFGYSFFALRTAGILVVLCLALTLYVFLGKRFAPSSAAFATIVSIVYYQSGVAHIDYDFIQFVTVYALLGAYFITRYSETCLSGDLSPQNVRQLFVAGCFASFAFLTKQSNGSFIVVFSFLAVALVSYPLSVLHMLRSLGTFALGLGAPLIAVLIWLLAQSAVQPFFDQVFFSAIATKGSFDHIFFAWTKGLLTPVYVAQLKTIAAYALPLIAISAVLTRGRFHAKNQRFQLHVRTTWAAVVILLSLASVLFPLYGTQTLLASLTAPGKSLINYLIVIATFTSVLLFFLFVFRSMVLKSAQPSALLILATVSLGLISGNGTSAGIGEVSAFVGLSIFIAYMFSLRGDPLIAKLMVVAFGSSLILHFAQQKFAQPYAWWSVEQPGIQFATARSTLPLLRGMRLSPDTVHYIDGTVSLIRAHSTKEDALFAFPHVSLFYLLADRWPTTKGKVHWFDFSSDQEAISDAQRIAASPPKIIVYLEMPEFVWSSHERLFRDGKPLGHRAIARVVSVLTSDKTRYSLLASYPVPANCTLKVWQRLN